MARILVTGVSGLLGLNLALDAMRSHEVVGVDRGTLGRVPFKIWEADLLDDGAVEAALDTVQPEWLIHCAALANLEECESAPDLARALNTVLPGRLAQACRTRGISLAHISTDAVFDGTRQGTYSEEDEPSPPGVYSRTKLEGEHAVLAENDKAVVARVNFYGWSLSGKRSLSEFFYYNLSQGRPVNGFTDVSFCPMWVNHTARTLIQMLERRLSGIYHLVGTNPMSKYQFGVEIARRFGLNENLIRPRSVAASELTARRSHNLALSTHKLSTALGKVLPDFSTGLTELFTQCQQGYPQKIRSYAQVLP